MRARTILLGAAATVAGIGLISLARDSSSSDGREVFPAASRPVQVPSPGRTGSGGVFCVGEPGWAWEAVPGGVLWSTICDGVVTQVMAFVPGEPPPLASSAAPWEASWPESEWANVASVDACESRGGSYPDTYRLDAVHGGRMQIARAVWADFFAREYNIDWATIVTDDEVNFRAALIIWERAGSWQPWPNCARGLY